LPLPTACAFRFSQPLGALFRPSLTGLISCQIRSWGSPFKALLLSCSRIPSPIPLPSCRLVCLGFLSALTPPENCPVRKRSNFPTGSFKARVHTPPSGFSSTQKSATRLGGLDQIEHIALLSLLPLQGILSHLNSTTFIMPPLMRLQKKCKHLFRPTAGSSFKVRSACLFQDCLPSWGLQPSDPSQLFDSKAARESPPQSSGFVTAPLSTLL